MEINERKWSFVDFYANAQKRPSGRDKNYAEGQICRKKEKNEEALFEPCAQPASGSDDAGGIPDPGRRGWNGKRDAGSGVREDGKRLLGNARRNCGR